MSTKTQTTTTRYHIQKKRRAEFLEEWRNYRQTVIRAEDVTLVPTARGLRTGVYMGWDGDRPTRCLDALVHEVEPGTDGLAMWRSVLGHRWARDLTGLPMPPRAAKISSVGRPR